MHVVICAQIMIYCWAWKSILDHDCGTQRPLIRFFQSFQRCFTVDADVDYFFHWIHLIRNAYLGQNIFNIDDKWASLVFFYFVVFH